MKKQLLFLSLSVFTTIAVLAQSVPNGGFENWNSSSYNDPQFYQTSNFTNILRGLPLNVQRVTDPQQGTYAIKMTTVTNGPDTSFGYFINGDPNTFNGGIPYNQHPVTLTGWYKSDIMPGDTGFVLVIFKQNGVPVSTDVALFTGQHTTYTQFTITLTIPPLATPDTVLLGGVSSNAFSTQGIPGSMLQLDNLVFNGASSQPAQMNGSFENWDTRTQYIPTDWTVSGDTLFRSGNAHSGSYCLRLANAYFGGSDINPGIATDGILTNNGPAGGRPYILQSDTLTGWYKFIPVGVDSATVWISCTNNSMGVGGAYVGLSPANNWTYFSIPFSSMSIPDTLQITFGAVFNNFDSTNTGSELYIDDLALTSSPLSTGINWNPFGLVTLFPNPVTDDVAWLDFTCANGNAVSISIVDASGRKISEENISGTGAQHYRIDTSGLAKGMYSVILEQNGAKTIRRFVKE